ncbi:MAG: tRNA preQ1(34) S-adenosylmethionine ribosyltransferase-isomerase QueA [Deltaproteobacteria bacterium]|nr:tRNA preQ1(34) S-adenosylmethionine ribosyltransferase-isomerase QueA [Candidatus Anaeroferrophillacea bacterium]
MDVDSFNYDLPPELIAQHPVAPRDHSRLLVLDRDTGRRHESRFHDLAGWLAPGDLLVCNRTRVLPARLPGVKQATGGRVEIFLVDRRADGDREQRWRCLARASKPLRPGAVIGFGDGFSGEICRAPAGDEPGLIALRARAPETVNELIEHYGRVPLPPYIRRDPDADDRRRYQTIFAADDAAGAVAAPTAGLHFTPDLVARLRERGMVFADLVLHVGLGTFMPVRVDRVEAHRLHPEWFAIPPATVTAIADARRRGGRVVAIGTTAARALEYHAAGGVTGGWCDIFIYPGYRFRLVDALITNFHLPRSTLLMLVAAFAGREAVLDAYRYAVARHFRFYSYGDGMFIR